MLKLSSSLKLPVDAATQTFAFIGRKGSGKTYGAGKLTELLIEAGVQTIILDLVGKWWGLRLAADGKSPGIDIAMLGGLRGDIPLEAAGGGLIADALLESGRSAILDISQFSKGGRQEFAHKFGERLWRTQKGQLNPSPVHLVIEESQLIVPENIPAGGKHDFMVAMYSTFEEIIRLGRNYGIGITMITQRPQSVAKEVLNQAEPLLVFQVTGSHERKAIREWINHQGMDQSMIDSLASLKKGECWFWSPEWLGELKQIQIEPKWTFDSTATPKVGERKPKARAIKPLDLSDLQVKMQATIEKAKADDPKVLRAKIADLEKQLYKSAQTVQTDPKAIERAVAAAVAQRDREWQAAVKEREGIIGNLKSRMVKAAGFLAVNGEVAPKVEAPARALTSQVKQTSPAPPKPVYQPRKEIPVGDSGITRGALTILIAIAQSEGADREQLSVLTGYKRSSRDTYLQQLRSRGLVDDAGGSLTLTDAGQAALPANYEPLPTGSALRSFWLSKLSGGEQRFLEALCDAYPSPIDKDTLSEATGYLRSSRDTYLQKLRARKLITEPSRRLVKASDMLFEGAK